MPYTPQTWADGAGGGTPITASRLNYMEAGISNAPTRSELLVNVRAYGATGDGSTNDTAAIQTAASTGKALYFPAGSYVCAPNLDLPNPTIVGAGRADTLILLTAGSFLIDSNQQWAELQVQNLSTYGGKGAIRNRFTGVNVTGQFTVLDCMFYDYTGPAISAEASDMPLWRVERCRFVGANDSTTIGVALPGYTDSSVIERNEFDRNYIHVKLGRGGNNAYIKDNGFVQFSAPTAGRRRSCIWVVPETGTSVNAGQGLVAEDNKYGPENQGADDLRILYADEGTGTQFGDRLPNLAADSTGFISGHTIRGGLISGAGSAGIPIIYSTTPHVEGCQVIGQTLTGTPPTYVFQLRTVTNSTDPQAAGNLAGSMVWTDTNTASAMRVSNQAGMWLTHDPAQTFEVIADATNGVTGGGRGTEYVNLLGARVTAFSLAGPATLTPVTDALGGADAAEAVLNAGTGAEVYRYIPTSALKAGTPIWLEFDLKTAASSALTELRVELRLDSTFSGGPQSYLRRKVTVPSAWRSYRLRTSSPQATNSMLLLLSQAGTGTNVQIGRVRMYHGREPVPTNLVLPDVDTTTTAPAAGGAGALPATPAGYMTVFINGTARKIAYY